MTPVYKYRMFVQARTDLTEDEIRRYDGKVWPWRDTGEFVYARRMSNAKAFYAALKGIVKPYKVKAEYVSGREAKSHDKNDPLAMRAWKGFPGVTGTIKGAADEVRHFAVGNKTACGLALDECWPSIGKPECPTCLEAAVKEHPEMRKYL